ncbi:MAG: 50S ribosomal protein L29 [Candidatus Doudnabacteria bacterium RIFCSPHIGHO2_02_FULL_46_11]|uniref:Large ribosomal subunit protein uL29 n=1 Tax=Candidatus Doudnabacteria bacterium RIFCSPHIGHO2_02_FULL_46_11 TaxID=1817832 RepID=A0A1F5P582_9BACT|nr:MAG: 50S ribosomal protein L29 [Candidatus Doudnabacteria bacterium RIFCSPHIGHO2_02_FULL_46_11]
MKSTEYLKELRAMDEKGLRARLQELNEKLRDLSFKTRGDEIRDMHEFRKMRKAIARVQTFIRQKTIKY